MGGEFAFQSAGVDGDWAGEGLSYYLDIPQNYAAFDSDHVLVGARPRPGAEHVSVACAEGDALVGLYQYKSGIEVLTFGVEDDDSCGTGAQVKAARGMLPVEGCGVDPGRFDGALLGSGGDRLSEENEADQLEHEVWTGDLYEECGERRILRKVGFADAHSSHKAKAR